MTEESFKDHPKSLNEARSDKSQNAKDWTPRDALIALLRDIDNKSEDIDALVIAFRRKGQTGKRSAGFYNASPDGIVSLGLLEGAKIWMCEQL